MVQAAYADVRAFLAREDASMDALVDMHVDAEAVSELAAQRAFSLMGVQPGEALTGEAVEQLMLLGGSWIEGIAVGIRVALLKGLR